MKSKSYVGINIQFPISSLILGGEKTIETRTYPIPPSYVNREMVLVETPGKNGDFKSRIVAIIKFGPSIRYKSKKAFYADKSLHCVTPDSPWAWVDEREKWGWPIIYLKILPVPVLVNKRLGIKYTKDLSVN